MKNSTKLKKFKSKAALGLIAVFAVSSALGVLSACAEEVTEPEKDETVTTSKPDTQLLKNGNFEFFNDGKDHTYYIADPNNWSLSELGSSSTYTESGILNTAASAWKKLTNDKLPNVLYANYLLKSNYSKKDATDEEKQAYKDNYVDYNDMREYDIPYKDTAVANERFKKAIDDKDTPFSEVDFSDLELIDNPLTHYNVVENSGTFSYQDENGQNVTVYKNENGDYFTDQALTKPLESNVLMLHNYSESTSTGKSSSQYYSSSTTITLEANTAATVSLWVKTSNLLYDNGNPVTQNRGAFIEIEQKIGSEELDTFMIKNINTEKIIKEDTTNTLQNNNGWIQYNVYVQACDYASTSLTLNLGLGDKNIAQAVQGYAFFDDVVVNKYKTIEDSNFDETLFDKDAGTGKFLGKEDNGTYVSLLSEGDQKIFEADALITNTNTSGDTPIKEDRFSKDFNYYIDLAAANDKQAIPLNNLKIGFTLDGDNYSALNKDQLPAFVGNNIAVNDLGTVSVDYYINKNLSQLSANNDVMANIAITDKNSITSAITGNYANLLADALASAADLPQTSGGAQTLIMLSAQGVPYTANISDNSFEIAAGEYRIVSLWVKTSDMNGRTAATITVKDTANKDNTATVALDTTGMTTDVDENNKDIFNGWVECFVYIQNDTDETQKYELDLKLGNTTIKDTTSSSYGAGWVAFSNMKTLEVSEQEFSYSNSGNNVATLTFSKSDTASENHFAEAINKDELKENITAANTYMGVNGASTAVMNGEESTYNYQNRNAYAGLINKEYLATYAQNEHDWVKSLLTKHGKITADAISDANAVWEEIFGSTTTQPLLIVNTLRTYADKKTIDEETFNSAKDAGVYYYTYDVPQQQYVKATTYDANATYYSLRQALNYGFIGNSATLSASNYSAISVKVKVSEGATANVYLTSDTSDVLGFETPKYTFWYDVDGNVLKAKPDKESNNPKANIAYTIRTDGLYQDANGNVLANLYSLNKKYYDESISYFDASGNAVNYDDLQDNGIYYADSARTKYAKHRLVAANGENVYEYAGVGLDESAEYYYFVNGTPNTSFKVKTFDTTVATPRYNGIDEKYLTTIEDTNGEWITVRYLIHTGNNTVKYKLELWSGVRGESGVTTTLGDTVKEYTEQNSYVAFDYSYISLTEEIYNNLLKQYTNNLSQEYISALQTQKPEAMTEIEAGYTLRDLEKLALKHNVNISSDYTSHYYTYTLFDSNNYVPFNEDKAQEGESGYDYDINDFSETLAYFEMKIDNEYNTFVDYATVEQNITKTTNTDTDTDEETTTTTPDANYGLLISSIVMVVALALTLIAMFVREFLKKYKKIKSTKSHSKNTYKQRKIYLKKAVDKNESPAEEQSTEEQIEEQPVEEQVNDEASEEQSADETETQENEVVSDEQPTDGE